MAKTIGYSSEVITGQIVEAPHVSQSIEAFSAANQQDYDISISGSFKVTGSQFIKPDTLLEQNKHFVLSYDEDTGQIFKMNTSSIEDGDLGNEVYRTGSKDSNIIPNKFGSFDNQGTNSVIASGNKNKIDAPIGCTFIGGGINSTASGDCSFIGAGQSLRITSSAGFGDTAFSSIVGGNSNSIINGSKSSIVGGATSVISASDYNACNNFIGATQTSFISAQFGFLGSGNANKISGSGATGTQYSAIVNGSGNHITGSGCSFIGSGLKNKINNTCNGFIGTGNCNSINNCFSFIGSGIRNLSDANLSVVVDGFQNTSSGEYSTIVNGACQLASGGCTFIGSGVRNTASGAFSVVVGGICNNTFNACTFIGGGCFNIIDGGSLNNIVGGQRNQITSSATFNTSIVGGLRNTASGACSFIGGGEKNFISSSLGTIAGGLSNKVCGYEGIQGCGNSILGGSFNTICAATGSLRANNTISGGETNQILKFVHDSYIGGGTSNKICGEGLCATQFQGRATRNAVIVGGRCNLICDKNGNARVSTILGGQFNKIIQCAVSTTPWCLGFYNTVVGGEFNCIIGGSTFTSGNIVAGGFGNKICGLSNSSILGGYDNQITGSAGCQQATNAIVSGKSNRICGNQSGNFIGGGYQNFITGSAVARNSILNGVSNKIDRGTGTLGCNNTILGGCSNTICNTRFSFISNGINNTINGFCNSAIIATSNKSAAASDYLYTCNICAFGDLNISGTANAAVKSFRIPHPDPEKTATYELWHTSIESPTAGDTMYRFSITTENNEAEIILPEYYRYLNTDSQLWVSADGHFGKAFGLINISTTKIKVTSNTDGKYNIMLVGTRKDKEALQNWKGAERLKNNL